VFWSAHFPVVPVFAFTGCGMKSSSKRRHDMGDPVCSEFWSGVSVGLSCGLGWLWLCQSSCFSKYEISVNHLKTEFFLHSI
jgi:hypothetical protein